MFRSGPKQAAEKGLHSWKHAEIHPSGAEALVDFIDLIGTAKQAAEKLRMEGERAEFEG